AAAAAFGESAGQVGGAAKADVWGAEPPPCLLRGPLF
ncbi:FAM177A1 isoform 7, partial [Pongo abelii]